LQVLTLQAHKYLNIYSAMVSVYTCMYIYATGHHYSPNRSIISSAIVQYREFGIPRLDDESINVIFNVGSWYRWKVCLAYYIPIHG